MCSSSNVMLPLLHLCLMWVGLALWWTWLCMTSEAKPERVLELLSSSFSLRSLLLTCKQLSLGCIAAEIPWREGVGAGSGRGAKGRKRELEKKRKEPHLLQSQLFKSSKPRHRTGKQTGLYKIPASVFKSRQLTPNREEITYPPTPLIPSPVCGKINIFFF